MGISLCNLCSSGSILGGQLYEYCQRVLPKDVQSNVTGGSSLAAPLLPMQNYLHASITMLYCGDFYPNVRIIQHMPGMAPPRKAGAMLKHSRN